MNPQNNIEKLITELVLPGTKAADERILNDALAAYERSETQKTVEHPPIVWRMIMNNRITKLAATAIVIIAVALSITFLDKSTATAYAVEQTVIAYNTLQYIHFKYFELSHEDDPKEFWLEYDENNQVKNMRMYLPEWAYPPNGTKIAVWRAPNTVQVWSKKENRLLVGKEKDVSKHISATGIPKLIEEFDPKKAIELLHKQEEEGKIEIEIVEPSDKDKPIIVTATSTPGNLQKVFFVDQSTKLVTSIEFHVLKDGEYQYRNSIEFYDYNQPIEAGMFCLDDEVPDDVTRLDPLGINTTIEEVKEAKNVEFSENLLTNSGNSEENWIFPMEPVVGTFTERNTVRFVKIAIGLELSSEFDPVKGYSFLIENKLMLDKWLKFYIAGLNLEQVRGKNRNHIRGEIRDNFNKLLFPESKPLINQVLFKQFIVQ